MSNTATAGLAIALALLSLYVYVYVDKWVQTQCDAVVSGVVRGVVVPAAYRRSMVFVRWVFIAGGHTAMLVVQSFGWWAFAENTAVEEVRVFAYLCFFIACCVAAAWMLFLPYWYHRLAVIMRQAEQR
jgi:hypothetical protein